MATKRKPRLAVWKLASCDGCQLTILDCEDELLEIAGAVDIAYFLEASGATKPGPYDVSLVEGSVTTAEDVALVKRIRRDSRLLVAIGACATAGGIQALRNGRDILGLVSAVYPRPEYIDTLATSTAVSDHVDVDVELRGCPISRPQLVGLLSALLAGRAPDLPMGSVCMECKRQGIVCVMTARGTPCLGPVTHAGCGALCPACARGCYGCFGPKETPNTQALSAWWTGELGVPPGAVARAYRTFNADAPAFRDEAKSHD